LPDPTQNRHLQSNCVEPGLGSSLFFLVSIFVGIQFVDKPVDCGCFGDLIDSKTGVGFLVRNVALFVVSIFVLGVSALSENKYGAMTHE
jgi:hypothetical protein